MRAWKCSGMVIGIHNQSSLKQGGSSQSVGGIGDLDKHTYSVPFTWKVFVNIICEKLEWNNGCMHFIFMIKESFFRCNWTFYGFDKRHVWCMPLSHELGLCVSMNSFVCQHSTGVYHYNLSNILFILKTCIIEELVYSLKSQKTNMGFSPFSSQSFHVWLITSSLLLNHKYLIYLDLYQF